jgi:hypothetical protein
MGLLSWLVKKQIARGQAHFDRSLKALSDAELAQLLDRSQFDGAVKIDPSRAPLVDSFLARVASGDFRALVSELESGALDLGPLFYSIDMHVRGTNIGRPFDYNRHYAAILRESARRSGGA